MTSFSERYGYSIKKVMQIDSIDSDTKIKLWNLYQDYYLQHLKYPGASGSNLNLSEYTKIEYKFLRSLWGDFLALDVHYFDNQIQTKLHSDFKKLINSLLFFRIFDLLEFTVEKYERPDINKIFIIECNELFEKENMQYRFLNNKITRITSDIEINEIEEALDMLLKPVNEHLATSLKHLSDRNKPDFRNSIKESISAVESLCNLINEEKLDSLGKTLTMLERKGKVSFHGALKQSFSSLYGWTSDAEGIRHGLMEEPTLEYEDAKFMLVSCSAFINYMVIKAQRSGINLF